MVLVNGIIKADGNFITYRVSTPGSATALSRNATTPDYITSPPPLIYCDTGHQLVGVDTFLVRSDSNVGNTFYRPVVSPKGHVYRNGTYGTWSYLDAVLWNPSEGKLLWWVQGSNRLATDLLTCTDPLTWTREANVLLNHDSAVHGRDWAAVVLNPDTSDASKKFIRVGADGNTYDGQGLGLWYSGDGRTWTEGTRGHVSLTGTDAEAASFGYDPYRNVWWIAPRTTLMVDYKGNWDPNSPNGYRAGDTCANPGDGNYYRFMGASGSSNGFPRATGDANWARLKIPLGDTSNGNPYLRVLRYREAPDVETLITRAWGAYYNNVWLCPDTLDVNLNTGAPTGFVPELYTMAKVPHGNCWVGLMAIYHGDGSGPPYEHRTNTQTAFSRDGFQWTRPADRTPFIPWDADASEANWKKNYALPVSTGYLLDPVAGTLHFPIAGANNSPQAEFGGCGWATLRQDGFASLDGNASECVFITRVIRWPADAIALWINADAAGGTVYVEVCDPNGSSLKFLAEANSIPCRANNLRHLVRWRAGSFAPAIAERRGLPVILKFYLTNAKLYSFWFTKDNLTDNLGEVNLWPRAR